MIYLRVNNYTDILYEYLDGRGEKTPLLFLWSNQELISSKLESTLKNFMKERNLDISSLFFFPDTGESFKIDQVKEILTQSSLRARLWVQIFFIERIERFTPEAFNACLKFFEEPGEGNKIILSNPSESGILETILSRVQKIYTGENTFFSAHPFYFSLLQEHMAGWDGLVRYFFSEKLEKADYVAFLKTLTLFSQEYMLPQREFYISIEEDIQGIMKNNLQAKYVVDRYILMIRTLWK